LFAISCDVTVLVGFAVVNELVMVEFAAPVAVTFTVYLVLNASLPVEVQVVPSVANLPDTVDEPCVTVTDFTAAPLAAVTFTRVLGATPVDLVAGTIATLGAPGAAPAGLALDVPAAVGLFDQCAWADVEHPLNSRAPSATKVATAVTGAILVRFVIMSSLERGVGRQLC
jgi:hypothetical protein